MRAEIDAAIDTVYPGVNIEALAAAVRQQEAQMLGLPVTLRLQQAM